MTRQLSVRVAGEGDVERSTAQVIASLPVSLRHSDNSGADLVAVAGTRGWAAEAQRALAAGAKGVLVTQPVMEDVTALADAAASAGVPVVIDGTWTYNSALSAGRAALAELDGPDTLVECRVDASVGSNLDAVLLAHLALVRAGVCRIRSLHYARGDSHGYDAVADLASGARANLSAILTDALPYAAHLRIVRPTCAVTVNLPAPIKATPGTAVVSDARGATLLPTQWETAHRAAWRHLHRLVTTNGRSDDLRSYTDEVNVARAATTSL